MKKITFQFRKWAFLLIFSFIDYSIFAQERVQEYQLGTNTEFLNLLQSQLNTNGKNDLLTLQVSDKDALRSIVNYYEKSPDGTLHLEGELTGSATGTYSIRIKENKLEGNIILPKNREAFIYQSDTKGNASVKKIDINKIICVDFHIPDQKLIENKVVRAQKNSILGNVSSLQSNPGAGGCLLLDFNGYVVPAGTGWNGGNSFVAAPSGMSDADILEAWELVSEDFRPFNLNVTTDENVFNSYAQNKRRRCVITPTNTASSGGAGVALINSFSSVSDLPCWVFTQSAGTYGKIVGEVASHELGHTLGLHHDGQAQYAYYGGHGNWAPIMGVSYYKNVTQWSKGEYSNGTNHEDDLSIISNTTNGVGYRIDDQGDSFTNATTLNAVGEDILATQNQGVIDRTDDIDVFKFHTNGGDVALRVQASEIHSNLRLKITLYNSQNVLITSATGHPDNLGDPVAINTSLTAGDYYLAVTGIGEGTPDTGYTSYASLGYYNISGTLPKIGTLAVDELENAIIYPKMVKNEFTIDTKKNGKYEVQILNSLGQLLYKSFFSDQIHQIAFADKPVGIYFVILKNTKTGFQKSHSIIKN
ncbi:zinc-dependent metalloprotease family protein [Chryseobacterium wanjuense]